MPEVGFNYLGQFDQSVQGTLFEPAPESTGDLSHPEQIRTQKLSINALVKHKRMNIHWIYSQALHNQGTIEQLSSTFVQHLQRLLDIKEFDDDINESIDTPLKAEDFAESDLNQDELDDLLDSLDF